MLTCQVDVNWTRWELSLPTLGDVREAVLRCGFPILSQLRRQLSDDGEGRMIAMTFDAWEANGVPADDAPEFQGIEWWKRRARGLPNDM